MLQIAGLEFIVAQIEKSDRIADLSQAGKREIGVHIHHDCEDWLKKRKGKNWMPDAWCWMLDP